MVNEEIVTGLTNSVNRGDSLQSAVEIMINSGYDPREVHEASRFVGGVIPNIQATPKEKQVIERQRAAIVPQQGMSQQQNPKTMQQRSVQQPTQKPPQPIQSQPIQSPTKPLTKTLDQPLIQPLGQSSKKSYTKEIVLVFILLLLIGVLTITIIYKNAVLGWFS